MPQKTFHTRVDPNQTKSGASNNTILGDLWSRYLAIPRKVRLYVGISTFIVALGSDYYLTQQEKALAAKQELEKSGIDKDLQLTNDTT